MRAFLDELGGRLAEAAAPQAVPARSINPVWRRLATGGAIALVGGVAVVALSAGSSTELPILGAPPADASLLAGRPGVPAAERFDLTASRAFSTPDGEGHVITSRDGRLRCVVLPDRANPGTYGSGCSGAGSVDTRGLAGEMVAAGDQGRPGRSLVAFVLPAGAGPSVRLVTRAGATAPVAVHDGVAVATLQTAAVLRFEVNGTRREHRFEAPFVDRHVQVECGGRTIELPPPRPRPHGKTPWRLGDRERLCNRARRSGGVPSPPPPAHPGVSSPRRTGGP